MAYFYNTEEKDREERLIFPNEQGQYNSRVMVRHWADERQNFEKVYPPSYETVTKSDFKLPIPALPFESHIRRDLENKYRGEGHKFLFVHADKAYVKNAVSTYDQDYNQLPKLGIDGEQKKRMKPWQLEKQLKTTSLAVPLTPSSDRLAGGKTACSTDGPIICRPSLPSKGNSSYRAPGYESETCASYRPLPKETLVSGAQRHATPRGLSVDFFKPNMSAKQYPIFEKGYPAFAVPEHTGIPPQLTKDMAVADETDFMSYKPLLSIKSEKQSSKPLLSIKSERQGSKPLLSIKSERHDII